jgi:hypothetical protein
VGVVEAGVGGVLLDGAGPGLVVTVPGAVVGEVVAGPGGGTVVGRGVISVFGSWGGVVFGVVITRVPSGAMVTTTGAGGRTMRYTTRVSANRAMSTRVDRRGCTQVDIRR